MSIEDIVTKGDLRAFIRNEITRGPQRESVTFARLPFQIAWGEVSAAGAVTSGSGNFTAAKNATGDYTVTFDAGVFDNAPEVVCSAQTPSAGSAAIVAKPKSGVAITVTAVTIVTFLSTTAAASDCTFFFVAIGAR